jgi:lipopolysaccharide/colanic/teichoic acid biosynthesis glycosyltransferase
MLRGQHNQLKRTLDIALAGLGLSTLWPVLVATAVAVKLDSQGPVFYRGVRTGLGGRPFRIFKFRTMVVDAERRGGPSTAKGDSRVTRLGATLRRYKLDELPQLLNVLVGDMSFVGPRPEVPEYTAMYQGEERMILEVKPGITDLASIEFSDMDSTLGSEDPDAAYRQRVLPLKNALRVKYVKERSLLGDARILVRTLVRLSAPRTAPEVEW